MDGALRVRATSRRASGSCEAHTSAVGEPTTISAAIPGPARVTTGAASPRILAATWDGVSRVPVASPWSPGPRRRRGARTRAAAAITGHRPGLDTATTTMSARPAPEATRRAGSTLMPGWNGTPSAGCGRCSRQACTTAVSYSVASTTTGWPIRARWVATRHSHRTRAENCDHFPPSEGHRRRAPVPATPDAVRRPRSSSVPRRSTQASPTSPRGEGHKALVRWECMRGSPQASCIRAAASVSSLRKSG